MSATQATVSDSRPAEAEAFQTNGVITVSAAHMVHDTFSAFLAPLLPVLIASLEMSKTAAGLLSVFYQGPSLLQPFIGHLADRANLRILVILAPSVAAIIFTLVGVAPSYGILALMLLVGGLSSAGLHAIGPVLAGVMSGRQLGRGMSYWMVGGETGRTLGPLITGAALTYLSPRGLPLLIPLGLLASLLVSVNMHSVPMVHSTNPAARVDWRAGLKLLRPILPPVAGLIATRAMLVMSLSTFLPTYLTEEGASLWLAGVSLAVMQVAGMAGALFGGSVSDRLGRRQVVAAMTLAAPLAALAFFNVTGWAQFPLLLLLGLTLLSTTPVMMAIVQERAPGSRALANGVFMALNFVITSLAIVLVGVLADRFGLRTAYLTGVGLMLAGLPFVLLLPQKR